MDADGDGYQAMECGGSDCDDGDFERHPGATEICDLDDEDCDDTTVGPDRDGDGYVAIECCNGATCGTDCNDLSMEINPEAIEDCNGTDDDCDRLVDEGVLTTYWRDLDGDGHGDPSAPMELCAVSAGWATTMDDCDDTAPYVHPLAAEFCDGFDQDCSAGGGVALDEDQDRDGFVNASASCVGCPSGASPECNEVRDCHDSLPEANPDQRSYFRPYCADERCHNGTHCGRWYGDDLGCTSPRPPTPRGTPSFMDYDCNGVLRAQPALPSDVCELHSRDHMCAFGSRRWFGPDPTDPREPTAGCGSKVRYLYCEDADPDPLVYDCQLRVEADQFRFCH